MAISQRKPRKSKERSVRSGKVYNPEKDSEVIKANQVGNMLVSDWGEL